MTNTLSNTSKISINGQEYKLRLSLGAMADIEEEFNLESISDLGEIFSNKVKIGDLLKLLKALLCGGGNPVEMEFLKSSDIDITVLGDAISACVGSSEKK